MSLLFSPAFWGVLVLLLAGAYVKGCSDERERFVSFKAAVAAEGRAAEERTRRRIAADKELKRKADERYAKEKLVLTGKLAAAHKRLRDNSRGSILPAAGPGSKRPDRITFDRAELDGAFRGFDSEIRGILDETTTIVGEGDEARLGLNVARGWVRGRQEQTEQ